MTMRSRPVSFRSARPARRAARPSSVPHAQSKSVKPPPASSIAYAFAGPPASMNGTGVGMRWMPSVERNDSSTGITATTSLSPVAVRPPTAPQPVLLSYGGEGSFSRLLCLFSPRRFERRAQLGQRLEQIGDEPVVGDLEDRRLAVLVDRDDRLAALHAGEVLNRAADPRRDVQVRSHHLAGLPDLEIVRHPPRITDRARSTDRRAELVSERL